MYHCRTVVIFTLFALLALPLFASCSVFFWWACFLFFAPCSRPTTTTMIISPTPMTWLYFFLFCFAFVFFPFWFSSLFLKRKLASNCILDLKYKLPTIQAVIPKSHQTEYPN